MSKNSQTSGIVLDLSKTSVTANQLSNTLQRVRGAGATNITDIIMPKILCPCENIIWLGEIPSPHQSLIISDIEFYNYQGFIDAEKLYLAMKIVVKCNNCGRLHIFWDGFDKPQTMYIPEKG